MQGRAGIECENLVADAAPPRRFSVTDLGLGGLKRVTRGRMGDARGFLSRLFCAEELAAAGWHGPVVHVNHSRTERAGTVRGLHWQREPHAETKLVSCLRGSVWDVAVDLRAGSPTCGCWHAERLTADNGCALLIPAGFAHGFQALEDGAELLYCHSAAFSAAAEAGVHPLDARLAIGWPLPVATMSARDAALPALALALAVAVAVPPPASAPPTGFLPVAPFSPSGLAA